MEENRISLLGSALKFVALVIRILQAYAEICANIIRQPARKSIKGQNVLITGSGHGLGREMALQFAQLGANLVLVDINEKNNEIVKAEIIRTQKSNSNPIKVLAYSVDIRDDIQVAKLASRVQQDLGDIDVLVNNAGIVQCLPFLELSPALVERTFQVNTLSHVWTIRHFLPAMIKNKRGHIVAIASLAGIIGARYLTDYCASKFAVVGLMESLDKELHDGGANGNIHLTTVCPASISTGMFQTFTTRFSWLLPVLRAEQVAAKVVDAILVNKPFVAVPPITLFFHKLSSIIPTKVSQLIQEYLDYGVKPHTN